MCYISHDFNPKYSELYHRKCRIAFYKVKSKMIPSRHIPCSPLVTIERLFGLLEHPNLGTLQETLWRLLFKRYQLKMRERAHSFVSRGPLTKFIVETKTDISKLRNTRRPCIFVTFYNYFVHRHIRTLPTNQISIL